MGRGHPILIPHFLWRLSSPSPDAEPSHFSFLSDAYASMVLAVIVCLSVCLFVRRSATSRSCTKTVKTRITPTRPYDRTVTLVFWRHKSPWNYNEITPNGAPHSGGVGSNRRFSTNISLYLRNDATQGLSYYGRPIETCIRSIEWR